MIVDLMVHVLRLTHGPWEIRDLRVITSRIGRFLCVKPDANFTPVTPSLVVSYGLALPRPVPKFGVDRFGSGVGGLVRPQDPDYRGT